MRTESERERHKVRGRIRLRSLESLDKRTAVAKKAASIVSALVVDAGGETEVTTAKRELIKRAALLGVYCEDCEVAWLKRQPIDVQLWLRAVGTQRRVLSTLGLSRHQRDINEDLESVYADALEDAAEDEVAESAED